MYNTTEDLLFIGIILIFCIGSVCLLILLYFCVYYCFMTSNTKINTNHSSLSPLPQDI